MRDYEKMLAKSAAQLREDLGPGAATEIAVDLLTKMRGTGIVAWSPSEQVARRVVSVVRELSRGVFTASELDEIYAAAERETRDVLSKRGGK